MRDFEKVVRLGTILPSWRNRAFSIFCKIKWNDGKLSISGVEGPFKNGDCAGSCGQIDMHLRDEVETINPASGWTHEKLRWFFDIWERWHLNQLIAGTPGQMEYLRRRKHEYSYAEHGDYYSWAKGKLGQVDFNPVALNGEEYFYGHAWLKEDVPDDVLEWLFSLPDTDKTPAWV